MNPAVDMAAVLLAAVWLVCGLLAAATGVRMAQLAWRDRRAVRAADRLGPRAAEDFEPGWAPEWGPDWP